MLRNKKTAVLGCLCALMFMGCVAQAQSNGRTCLRHYEWTQHHDWFGDFCYERHLVANYQDSEPEFMLLPAYTLAMTDEHVRQLRRSPWVMPTPSADENFVLGMSAGWPEGKPLPWPERNPLRADAFPGWDELDFHVPPQKIYGFMITDPSATGDKIKIILTGGNHPVEFSGNWALHAMIEFIISDDPRAAELRRGAIFYVYPQINPDGRYLIEQILHVSPPEISPTPTLRGSPELYAAGQIDHNRVWETEGRFVTVDTLKAAMRKDTGGKADYSWDFHGGRRWRHDYRSLPRGMESRYAGALKQREPTVPQLIRPEALHPRLWGWLASEDGLNVPHPFLYEPHQLMEKERIFEVGRSLALGLYDVVTDQAPRPEDVAWPGPDPVHNFIHTTPERARRLSEQP